MRRWIVGLLCWFAGAVWASPVTVQGVRLWTAPDNTRVVLELSGPAEHQLLTLTGPDRVVIDVRNARMQPGVIAQGKQGVIQGLRTGIRDGHDLRVVLDLKNNVKPRSYYLKPDSSNGHRIVVDLRGVMPASTSTVTRAVQTPPVRTVAAAAPVAATLQTPAVTPKIAAVKNTTPTSSVTPRVAKPVEPTVQATAVAKPRTEQLAVDATFAKEEVRAPAATTSAPVKTARAAGRERALIVAIDAGHGGKDVGARGPSGTHEKDVVLAIARKLAALVEKEPGMRPVLVRDGDYFIRLRDRMQKARKQHADLFVSIHADAFDDHRARGSSVFVVSERGATSEMARILADQENAADLAGGVSLNDKDELLKSVLLDLSQSASIEASMNVADNVLGELKQIGNVHKSRVQQAGFMVLKSPDVPSILVETAFISNPAEERLLRDARHQQRLAAAIMKGIRAYFRDNPPPGTVMANRDSDNGSASSVASRESNTATASAKKHVIKRGETLSGLAERYAVSLERLRVANNLSGDGDRLLVGSVLRIPTTDS
jgi:N-acetylmuramoyl-L-alanine amidase